MLNAKTQRQAVQPARVEELISHRKLNDAETLEDERAGTFDGEVPFQAIENSRIQRTQTSKTHQPTEAIDPYGEERIAKIESIGGGIQELVSSGRTRGVPEEGAKSAVTGGHPEAMNGM